MMHLAQFSTPVVKKAADEPKRLIAGDV